MASIVSSKLWVFNVLIDEGDVVLSASKQKQCQSVSHVTLTARVSENKIFLRKLHRASNPAAC